MSHPPILLLVASNFVNAPLGGILTATRMLIKAIGPQIAIAGWTVDPDAPIGQWHKRVIDGIEFDFFAVDYVPEPVHKRPFLPARAKSWIQFKRYGKAIRSCGIRNILTREAEIVMAMPFEKTDNVCFWYPGVFAPLAVSRYEWAKSFSIVFDYVFNLRLRRYAKTILAAADDKAIKEMRQRAYGLLDGCEIGFFPTRVDTNIFKPSHDKNIRERLLLPQDAVILIVSGRLHWIKGWPLVLDAFKLFLNQQANAQLIFVGDGSDRATLEQSIVEKGLTDRVFLAGHQPPEQLALYLQASDLFVMGSIEEGWSTALVEALATGLPIASTKFSSADSIVKNGINGFVVDREPVEFAQAMAKALKLEGVRWYSSKEVDKYALCNLAADLAKNWPLL